MKESRTKLKGILTIILLILTVIVYILLEEFFYSDFGSGCSSTGTGFYPTLTSKIIGWTLLFISTLCFIASVWKFKGISKWWTIPSVIVFMTAFYGNGYMLFNKGGCGLSINKTTFFIDQTKLGDFAKTDGETLNLDSLKAGKYKGKLIGFSLSDKNLTIYRIGEQPLNLKTTFLFWRTDNSRIIQNLSYGLNTYRNLVSEKTQKHYEFIGGQGMTIDNFLEELRTTEKWINGNIKKTELLNVDDGTTRLIIETK